jgi:SAM-dependent methyltransferase
MNYKLMHLANRILSKPLVGRIVGKVFNKYKLEAYFWNTQIKTYIGWYRGEIKDLYGCASPKEHEKIYAGNEKDSAIVTFLELFQKRKYLADLELEPETFNHCKVLDIGSGPFPSALAFNGIELYCLDPLLDKYKQMGYPIDYFKQVNFVGASSENMPFETGFFDAIISVNALDHVDDLAKTVAEIKRILKPQGKLAFHIHMHPATMTEPIHIDHEVMMKLFNWCPGFKRVHESDAKYGWKITEKDEIYALYRNF